MASALKDAYERKIDYLRLSITDRCNLRCLYCTPKDGVQKLHHNEILRYEEILRLAHLAIEMGITKIRITGGEPLARKDAIYLCKHIARMPGLGSLSITTNGVLLKRYAEALFNAGIKRINISLDTLMPDKYQSITGRDCFHEVWDGIETALAIGFSPIKLNAVVMLGVNDDEIEALGTLTYQYPFHVRFIEFMPVNSDGNSGRFLSADAVLERLSRTAPLIPAESKNSNGPARYFCFPDSKGKIGIISPISHHFCPNCNRLRLTPDGKLRTCLFAANETDLRALLRGGATDSEIIEAIRTAIAAKPEKHKLDNDGFRKCINRSMVSIGG